LALPLAELALLLALWHSSGLAATIPVDGTACTLAAAITAANIDAESGDCPAGSGADTLVLPVGGTLTLTGVDNSTYGETGLPVVTSTITIAGQGSMLQRDTTATDFRILAVGGGGDLTVEALTLRGGIAEPFRGGGVANYGGSLTLTNSTVSGNSAVCGGGVYNTSSLTLTNSTVSGNSAFCGGGVYNTGSLTLSNSTISGNSADDAGGGVFNFASLTLVHSTLFGNSAFCGGGAYNAGTLSLINSTLSGNMASCSGGGVYNFSGTLTVTNSTLSGNTADGNGGGMSNLIGTLTVTNSTLSGNRAANNGGGVYNYGTLVLANSTLSGNTADGDGGGVLNGATLTMTNSTLSGNTAANDGGGVSSTGTLTLARTLVSGNTANAGAEIFASYGGSVTVDNFNLLGQDDTPGVVGFAAGATDIVPPEGVILSAILDSLAFNGGPTQTHNLLSGSVAVDKAPTGSCPPTDQRGFARPFGGPCDIGAVELGASLPPVVNSRVNFVVLSTTFSTTTDATGCPDDSEEFAGKFFFQAELTNLAGNPPLAALKDQVVELTNGNLVQTADGGPAGVESLQTLPEVGAFSDGVLEPMETLVVPLVICLQNLDEFRFTVDVLGLELEP
jgi:hypothetical protein